MAFRPTRLGKFYLYEKLAVGGMAEIFKAKLFGVAGFEKTLVVKLILPEYANEEEFVKMFIDEANIAVSLNHANIVPVYELGRIGERYYMAMEFVDGENLETVVETWQGRKGNEQPLPLWHSIFIAHEVSKGLDFAHTKTDASGQSLNIVHRDVSPQNVMISFDGEVKLVDFGIAKAASKLSMTRVGTIKGKFEYMSPEQAYGESVDGRSDVYSLGIVLWELLTGKPLFTGRNEIELLQAVRDGNIPDVTSIVPGVPREILRVLDKALARDANERYSSAAQFQAALARLLYGDGGLGDSRSLGEFMRKLYGRRQVTATPAPAPSPGEAESSAPSDERTVSFAISEAFAEETRSDIQVPGAVPAGATAELTTQHTRSTPDTERTVPRGAAVEAATSSTALTGPTEPARPPVSDSDEDASTEEGTQRLDLDESEKTMVSSPPVRSSGSGPAAVAAAQAQPRPAERALSEPTNHHVSLSDLLEPEPPPSPPSEEVTEPPITAAVIKEEVTGETDTATRPARPQSSRIWTVLGVIGAAALFGGLLVLLVARPWKDGVVLPTGTPVSSQLAATPTASERAAPTPAARALNVTSSPDNAVVLVGGKEVGRTPLRALQVPVEEEVEVVVRRTGFRTWTRKIPAGKQDINLTMKLRRIRRPRTPTPTRRRTPTPASSRTPRPTQTAVARTPTPTPVQGASGTGTLVLNADPWATVFIDGKRIQNTPILGLKLSAGAHDVRLVNSELGVTRELKVTIQTDKEKRLIINMREKP